MTAYSRDEIASMTDDQEYYSDSVGGVRRMLEENADDSIKPKTFTPDPWVKGCWMVTCEDGTKLLCYVGDHEFAGDFEEVF